MGLFKKKCEYCKVKINKSEEIFKSVKVPGFIGTYPKYFCCEEHVAKYEEEVEEYLKNSKGKGGNCCG